MKVSLVMPTWNGGALLGEVLERIDRQPGAAQLERFAIDSGSSDGTVERLRAHGFTVETIPQSEFNHGATRDRAILRTRGEVVVLLTQDALPRDERWLPELLAPYADARVGAAYCRQEPRPDCNPFLAQRLREWTAGRDATVLQRVADRAEYEALAPLERLQRCAFDNVASSVRRSSWERFKFGRRAFGEDVAFGRNLILAGECIAFAAASVVIHSHDRSPRDEGRRIYCDHQNLRALFGVHVLPTRADFENAVAGARTEFAKTVEALALPAAERDALKRWARGYALWSAAGIFLGGNAREHLRGPRAAHYRRLDAWMHRGI